MKSTQYVWLFLFLASTIMLAQTNPVPFVNQPPVPTATAPGGPNFTLTINGTGFVSGSAINWNGVALATTFISGSELTAIVPAANIAQATTATLSVTSPSPGGGVSNTLFFCVCAKVGSIAFAVSQILPTGSSPQSVVVGDFNGDGKLDLAVANQGSGTISVYLGNGDGTFQSKVDYPTIPSPVYVITRDFNGDGNLDLAVESPGEMSVLLGNGDGTFQTHVDYPGDQNSLRVGNGLVAGDFNGDGKLDLAVGWGDFVEPGGGTIGGASIYLGNGDGTFQPYANTPQGQGALWLSAGDVNDDGKLDLTVIGGTGPDVLGMLFGNGDGTFSVASDVMTLGNNQPYYVALADFNGDGKLDAVVDQNVSTPPFNLLLVLLGNGDGTFQQPLGLDFGGTVAMGDFDGDGNLDLTNGAIVLLGNGSGGFAPANMQPIVCGQGGSGGGNAVGDFNGDGRLDLVIVGNDEICVELQSGSVGLQPTSLNFATYPGGTSSPQSVTLSNTAGGLLDISSITASANFAQTNNCPGTLGYGSTCTIMITFTPPASGSVSGTVNVTDNGPGSPQALSLTGVVQDFAIAGNSPTSVTVAAGQAANYSISVSPVNGFNQTIQLSCSGFPAGTSCMLSPSSIVLNGSAATAANVAVVTTAAAMGTAQPYVGPFLRNHWDWRLFGSQILMVLMSLFFFRRQRRAGLSHVAALFFLFALGFILTGCGGSSGKGPGGGGGGGTTAGTYTLTVTGTFTSGSAVLTHSTPFTLVVQ